MPSVADPTSSLVSSLGSEKASAILRRLVHVPAAVEWVTEERVAEALARENAAASPAPVALLAATGHSSLDELSDGLPATLAPRREELLAQGASSGDEDLSADDALILVAELLRVHRSQGAGGVVTLLRTHPVDWRAPLACAWTSIEDRPTLARSLIAARAFSAIVAAVRSNHEDAEAARELASAAGPHLAQLIAYLVAGGDFGFADRVAQAAGLNSARSNAEADSEGSTPWQPLASTLHAAWEAQKRDLASITDAIAAVAEEDGDQVSAIEARRRALQLEPSDVRLAELALTLVRSGDVGGALEAMPPTPQRNALELAAGVAYVAGGAVEKGRALLTEDDLAAGIKPFSAAAQGSLAAGLADCGETSLALEALRMRLGRSPADATARSGYAQKLLESGDPDSALAEARLAGLLNPQPEAAQIEGDALADLGRTAEAVSVLKGIDKSPDLATWRRLVAGAIASGSAEEIQGLLAAPPAGAPDYEVDLRRAEWSASDGKRREAIEVLEKAIQGSPRASELWTALAEAQDDPESAGETLRRAAQMTPGDVALQAALARWLRLEGRASEAYEAAAQSLQVDPDHVEANVEAGMALLRLGRADEARERLRTAHRKKPARFDVRLALAEASEALGDLAAARRLFVHMPRSAPAEAWFASGRLATLSGLSDAGQAKEAASRLLRARNLGCKDRTLDYWLGISFEASQDPTRAARAYNDFLGAGTTDSELRRAASLRKARCLLESGDATGAIRDYEEIRKSRGDDPEVLRPLARAYLTVALAGQARESAEALLRLDPDDREALAVLESVASATGDWKPAAKALRVAAERNRRDAGLWIEAGEASLHAGSPQEARLAIDQSLAASPDVGVRRRAASALVELGDTAQATRLMEEVAVALPYHSSVWMELADVCAGAGDREREVEAVARAASLSPNDAEIHARHAAALVSLGRHVESVEAWRKAHEQSRDNPTIHAGLAQALVATGQVQVGLNEFASALRGSPSDIQLLTEAGLATLRHGSPNEAIELLQPAVAREPGGVRALVGLGEAWLRLRQPDRAARALRSACESSAAGPGAWALLAEAELSMGDAHAAEESILQARRLETSDTAERIGLARAELRAAHWKDALTALTPVLLTKDPAGQAALADAILRIHDARWLYGKAGQAPRHAPPADVPGETLTAWLDSYLKSADSATAAVLRLRLTRAERFDDDALASFKTSCMAEGVPDETLEALAIACLAVQRPQEALQILKRLRPDMLGASWQAVLAGLAHLQAGDPALAARAFEDAEEDAGLRPLAAALRGQAHLALGEKRPAIDAFNEAVAQWPDEPAWQTSLARLYMEEGNLDAALPHWQTASDLDSGNPAIRISLARTLRDAGHLSEALQAYERVLPHASDEPAIWHEAGEVAMGCGDAARAESFFDRAASLAPGEAKHLIGAAGAALAVGNLREARRRAEHALQLAEDDPAALQVLAAVVAGQGDVDRALELLDRAMAVAEDPAPLRAVRSRLLIDNGRAGAAASELRQHLSQHPEDEQAWPILAEALEETSDLAAAGEALEHALRLAPRSARLHIRLARISRKAGQLDRALDELRQAGEIDPLDPELAIEFGQVYEARREFDRALDSYRRAAEVNPRSAEAFRRAAAVLKSLKAYGDAGRMLERATQLDPADTATLQQLAAVRALELVHGGTYATAVTP